MKAKVPQNERLSQAEPLELKALFESHYNSICQLLFRLGVPRLDLDDAAQEVFWVAARRLNDIERGREHAFLYGVALRISYHARRKWQTHDAPLSPLELVGELHSERPNPEQVLGERQAEKILHAALGQLAPDLKAVFVLYELEELELKEIAAIVEIPLGTVNSRLRRARSEFGGICKRLQAITKREVQP